MAAGIYTDFNSLQSALPQLADLPASPGSIFQTLAWFRNLHLYGLSSASNMRLALLADEAGCLPLLDDGEKLSALSNYYSSLFAPLNPSNALPAALPSLLGKIGKRAIIDLHPLDHTAAYLPPLKQALSALGYWVSDYHCFANWYLDVAGQSFESYMRQRPSQLRSNVERGRGKLNKAGSWHIHIQQADDAQLDDSIAAFETVYAHSWKNAEPSPNFIPQLCRTAARNGWLRLGILRLDGNPIAAQLWLTYQGTANIYKLAYVEAAKPYSAGSILTAALMEHALDIDQVSEVDYLTGDESYKADWMSHRRERRGLIAFRLDMLSGLLAALRHTLGRLRQRFAEGA